jgi:hypothetical protein
MRDDDHDLMCQSEEGQAVLFGLKGIRMANHLNPTHQCRLGKRSVESVTSEAFGPKAYVFSMALVVSCALWPSDGAFF